MPYEIREATLSANTSQDFGLTLTADGQEIEVEQRDDLKLVPPIVPGARTYMGGFFVTARGFSQLKSAKVLQLQANTPGRFRPAQFWTVLSTAGLHAGLLLLER